MPSVVAIISGALTGVALRLYVSSGNGFEVGPGIFAATILPTLAAATHVSGMNCYPCVRNGPEGKWRALLR